MGKAKGIDHQDPESLKTAGNKAFMAQNFEEAEKMFSEAIALNDKNHIYFANSKLRIDMLISFRSKCIPRMGQTRPMCR